MGLESFVKDVTGISLVEDAWDSISGESQTRKAKEAAAASDAAQREAAAKARDIAIDYNQRALQSQLESGRSRSGIQWAFGGAAKDILADTRGQLAPLTEAGTRAASQLQSLYGLGTPEEQQAAFGAFQTSPGYEFRQAEGDKAIRRLASARGQLGSGAMYKDLLKYNQGLASDEYGNYVTGLSQLARMTPVQAEYGLGVADMGLAERYGDRIGGIAGQMGDARSSAYLGEGAAKAGYETTSGQLLSQLAMAKEAAGRMSGIGPTLSNLSQLASFAGSVMGVPSLPGLGMPGDAAGMSRPTYSYGSNDYQMGPFDSMGVF